MKGPGLVAWFGRKKRRITRLLVVEDEPLVAFDAEHMLGDAGYVVVGTVDRVTEAVRLIGDGASIDLVLVDMNLADGSGMDVAIAARAADVPVIFVTGQRPSDAMTVAVGCLSKPYLQRDMLAAIDAVDAVLAGREPRRIPAGLTLFPQG
ncbi:response regulator [Sphingomonas bacterium]|uniref:response regulator n=1 Tax=Sphingomonas bacterium TaxID=1895847 RepID=UPI0015755068|nr:response regulator [Sphingomonas bacterium]